MLVAWPRVLFCLKLCRSERAGFSPGATHRRSLAAVLSNAWKQKLTSIFQTEQIIWVSMTPGRIRLLALAVGLIFTSFGVILLLAEADLSTVSLLRFFIVSISPGILAACLILYGRSLRKIILLVAIYVAVLTIPQWLPALVPIPGAGGLAETRTGWLGSDATRRQILAILGTFSVTGGYAAFLLVVTGEVRERTAFRAEIMLAQSIQKSLLPQEPFSTSWCEISGITLPTLDVGGDYFDIIELAPGRILVTIADVSGHGVGAGIISAMTKSALHSHLRHTTDPATLLAHLNESLFELSDRRTFVTLALVLLDPADRTARIATAGHLPILHFQQATAAIDPVRTPNLALGIRKDRQFDTIVRPFRRGDGFFLYTDGMIEAPNRKKEEFGEARLLQSFRQAVTTTPRRVCEHVVQSIRYFAANSDLPDDATVVYISLL